MIDSEARNISLFSIFSIQLSLRIRELPEQSGMKISDALKASNIEPEC